MADALELLTVLADIRGMGEIGSSRAARLVTAFGETKRISDWVRDPRCAVAYAALYHRLVRAHWRPETAITQERYRRVTLVAPISGVAAGPCVVVLARDAQEL